jgi:hypothetical protein
VYVSSLTSQQLFTVYNLKDEDVSTFTVLTEKEGEEIKVLKEWEKGDEG